MNLNLLQLRKQLLQLAEISTDKGTLIIEGELSEGVEVFVESEEGFAPAADGEYIYEDMLIVVAEGKISELRKKRGEDEPAEETPKAEEQPEEIKEEKQPAEEAKGESEPEPDEKDAKIAELQDKLNELEAIIAERDARIAELEAELAQKQEELEMSADEPAKDRVKSEQKVGALKYFN